MKPMEGVLVLDFTQFLSGPSASLRMADLGAEVVKVEQPTGDICRRMYTSNLLIDEDSSLFHIINRNKSGISVDLKTEAGRNAIHKLIKRADVLLINFRPEVGKRLALDYETVREINPRIVYGEVTGYGHEGVWSGRPGQDLLVQAVSGICMGNGNSNDIPTPIGLSVVDLVAGQQLVQGVMAGLIQAGIKGEGCLVQVSMLEAAMDLQFEEFTTFLNDDRTLPERSAVTHAGLYRDAPYGIYATKDGYIAIAAVPIPQLGELLGCKQLTVYTEETEWSAKRDEIKAILAEHLRLETTHDWLEILKNHDIWSTEVLNWDQLRKSEGFLHLNMIQKVKLQDGKVLELLRCPITIDGEHFCSEKPAPKLGQDNERFADA